MFRKLKYQEKIWDMNGDIIRQGLYYYVLLFCRFRFLSEAFSYPIKFTDSQGQLIIIEKEPVTVVSLVPSITEVIFKIGAGHVVKGVTYCDNYPRFKSDTITVGGFLYPSIERIHAIGPEIVLYPGFIKG